MQTQARQPVKFDTPPVAEVACGIAFSLPRPLKSAHVGLYWAQVAKDFPRSEDAAPIAMVMEGSPDQHAPSVQVEFLQLPEMRRTWLINEPGTHLIQLQEDRFLFNWKRTSSLEPYPSYSNVIAGFHTQWNKYKNFLVDQKLGEPAPTQLELTYINLLFGLDNYFRDYDRVKDQNRFLPESEAINWRSQFLLPNSAGRLHVTAISVRNVETRQSGIRLELTARGMPADRSESGCQKWFDLAHEWITHGFADLTTEEAHKYWGRTA